MLKRIRIQRYKSLTEVEVHLQPLSVLFGPNAAGKSNFLDSLQLLSNIVTKRSIKEAFDPPYRGKPLESFTLTSGGVEELYDQESVSFSIEVDVELSQNVIDFVNRQIHEMKKDTTSSGKNDEKVQNHIRERLLRYRIEIEILPKTGILRVADESLTALTKSNVETGSRRPFLSREKNRLHLRMEGQAHPRYFDLKLDHSILSLSHYWPHYPHLIAFREELSRYSFFYFEPRERMRNPSPVREVLQVGSMGEDLPSFLNTLKSTNPQQFRGIENALKMVIPSITGIEVEPNRFGEVDLWLREGDRRCSSRVISEGTLRILGLLAMTGTKRSASLIGLEEPENGIPPRRIKMIAELLQNKSRMNDSQIIVTTHSALLPDYVDQKFLFPCKKVDGKTEILPFSSFSPSGLLKKQDIEEALLEEEETSPSERMLRGDFDD